jgi:hypothetical protein
MNSSMRCGIAVLLLGAATAPAVEPWADPGLKVTEGLELWLDASKQDGAMWAMQGAPLIPDRTPLGVWYDGSGHRRHVLQRMKTSQPEFRRVGLYAAGRFDGVDDFLSLHTTVAGRREWTVFVLASPRSNAGGYGAMMSMAKGGRSDFQSGLTIDLGPEPGEKFQTLNVEGAGFSGATDLMDGSLEWDRFHTVAVRISANVSLHIDGQAAGRRKRGAPLVHMEELAIGARLYNHTGPTPFAQGFFHGDIAEVLVYGRALSDAEMAQVESYLAGKRDAMRRAVAETGQGRLLRPLADAPQVQVLAPGFTVREMPVDLTPYQQREVPARREALRPGLQRQRLAPERQRWRWPGGPGRAVLEERWLDRCADRHGPHAAGLCAWQRCDLRIET